MRTASIWATSDAVFRCNKSPYLYVKDLEKSARFYGETLALQLVLD